MTEDLTGLGRRVSKDARDHEYLIPKRSTAAATWTSRYWAAAGGVLDQGATSQCVAYSGVKYLQAAPVMNKQLGAADCPKLYKDCQRIDEWPGENYDGTSVRALFKVLKSLGYVSEYRWAFDAETIVNHVLLTGPVVMGTVWTLDMFMPRKRNYYITPTGPDQGGHAWLIIGANRKKENPADAGGGYGAVRMINSWGAGWGDKGRAWISFRDLDKLIKADGEACVAKEVLKK